MPSVGPNSVGMVTLWLHSTVQGTSHSHFGLSSAVLKDECIAMGIQISENYVIDIARSCRNGFSQSRVDSLNMQE
eukprot:5892008-Amphidinium_carterae.4